MRGTTLTLDELQGLDRHEVVGANGVTPGATVKKKVGTARSTRADSQNLICLIGVVVLGIALLVSLAGAVVLAVAGHDKTPELLNTLGSAAAGALAGLLVSPVARR